jgi:hypothetical protein
MSIDDTMETIEFPNPITLDKAEELLHYVANNLPCDIEYNMSREKYISGSHSTPEHSSFNLSAYIIKSDVDDQVFFKSSENNENLFTAIQTFWDEDLNGNRRKLFNDTKEIIEKYFRETEIS